MILCLAQLWLVSPRSWLVLTVLRLPPHKISISVAVGVWVVRGVRGLWPTDRDFSQHFSNPRYVSRYVYVCVLQSFTVRTPDSLPDSDGNRAPKMKLDPARPQTRYFFCNTTCFTICLRVTRQICFTICFFISPDLDGYRAPKMKYCPTETHDMFTICLFITTLRNTSLRNTSLHGYVSRNTSTLRHFSL
jgi:hypothetical protein